MTDAPIRETQTQTAASPRTYQKEILMRFGDCDPAGIVFYPRYLEIFNSLVEDWCREELQFSFPDIINSRGWGLPTVHLEVDFVAPSSFGDVLSAELSVRTVGTSSTTVDIVLRGQNGSDRVRGNVVLVVIDRKLNRSIAIPDELRARLVMFRANQ